MSFLKHLFLSSSRGTPAVKTCTWIKLARVAVQSVNAVLVPTVIIILHSSSRETLILALLSAFLVQFETPFTFFFANPINSPSNRGLVKYGGEFICFFDTHGQILL
jgi:hypothetical protein